MNYTETLQYLFTRLPMFSRVGAAAYKADLNNTIELLKKIGNPENEFRSIHIAGTNGKGSVSHMLAAILQTAGYKTGLYTSPHLKDFRERIRVNGEMITKEFVVDFTERIYPEIEKIEPSFFEITVAMAFDYFRTEQVDIAVIETGLGGRLDSTNVIHPEVSVITNIGWDHMNLLGDSLEKIAKEKAGIIKQNTPVVVGEADATIYKIFQNKASSLDAPISLATETRRVMNWSWKKNELEVEISSVNHTDHQKFQLDLTGLYQTKNLLTVLEVCTVLNKKKWKLEEHHVMQGLKHVKKLSPLFGRWEIIQSSPLVVLDVAHNEAGLRQVLQQVEITSHRELHLIIGMVNDKDPSNTLSLLPRHARYYFTKAQIPRALNEVELMNVAISFGLKGSVFADVNEALAFAQLQAHPDDLILVCGSIFVVAEVNH